MGQILPFTIVGPLSSSSPQCEAILRSLPDWFGIEEAIVHYVAEIERLPTFLAVHAQHGAVGFLSLKQHYPQSTELYVMAVRQEWHRRGVGRALLAQAEAYLVERDVEVLQVKTLGPSHPDENYAQTRRFYQAMGFLPLEEIHGLWGEHNPCLLMLKRL